MQGKNAKYYAKVINARQPRNLYDKKIIMMDYFMFYTSYAYKTAFQNN